MNKVARGSSEFGKKIMNAPFVILSTAESFIDLSFRVRIPSSSSARCVVCFSTCLTALLLLARLPSVRRSVIELDSKEQVQHSATTATLQNRQRSGLIRRI